MILEPSICHSNNGLYVVIDNYHGLILNIYIYTLSDNHVDYVYIYMMMIICMCFWFPQGLYIDQ